MVDLSMLVLWSGSVDTNVVHCFVLRVYTCVMMQSSFSDSSCFHSVQNDLRFGVEQDVDVVFASFIRKAKDIEEIKKELGEKGRHIWIISKVCKSS